MAKRLQLTFDDGPEPVAAALNPILSRSSHRVFCLLFHVKPFISSVLGDVREGLFGDGHSLVNFEQTA